jgi:hypothetical protein
MCTKIVENGRGVSHPCESGHQSGVPKYHRLFQNGRLHAEFVNRSQRMIDSWKSRSLKCGRSARAVQIPRAASSPSPLLSVGMLAVLSRACGFLGMTRSPAAATFSFGALADLALLLKPYETYISYASRPWASSAWPFTSTGRGRGPA